MAKKRGMEETLRSIVNAGAGSWILSATITAINEHPRLGYLVDLEAKPSRKALQARLLFLSTRANGGSLDPVNVGDEVLVFMPAGQSAEPDPNKAIAIAGLNSALVPLPGVFDNTNPQRVHPDGYDFRTANADAIAAVVREDMLNDFGTWLSAFDTFLTATSVAVTAPNIAAAAVVMISALDLAFGPSTPPGTGFTKRVQNLPAAGGAGYRSTAIKSS